MPYFTLTYKTVRDFASQRMAFRAEHLDLAKQAHARGELVMAGAVGDPPDRALLVFRTPDQTVPEQFAKDDPYVKQGLVTGWEVRPWNVVIGNQSS
jgi:uncharacterized protein YciI